MKKEEEQENAKKDAYEKYGDKVLLHRFNGIGLLGGCPQYTFQRPGKRSPKVFDGKNIRPEYPLPKQGLKIDVNGESDTGVLMALCSNDLWQVNGPKFVGQPTAAVNKVPYDMKKKGLV